MFQFNSALSHSLSSKLFPYWRLTSLLSTSVINPEISNGSKQEESTFIQDNKNASTKNKLLKNTLNSKNNLSKTFQHNTNSEVSLQQQIEVAKSTEDLIGIMKNPSITIEQVKEILNLISSKNIDAAQSADVTNSLIKPDIKRVEEDSSKMLPLSTPSLIQVLKRLSYNSDRNVTLIKTLTYNITAYSDQLDIKMCGDILYSLSVLNYVDENLLNKVMVDLCEAIPKTKKTSILGSIVTSIGLLRYKNSEVLDVISKWAVSNYKLSRFRDIVAILHCFATCGYIPANMKELQELIHSLQKKNVKDKQLWLDFVWSLTILNSALPSHIVSVLNPTFVKEILEVSERQKYMSMALKLLNINGAAQCLCNNYKGPLLSSDNILAINVERKKQKQEFIRLLHDTLKEVAPSCFETNVYTNMGFFIDAVCYIDSNNKFMQLSDVAKNKPQKRLALMIHDYHDYCRAEEDLVGVIKFYNRILIAQNYKVLNLSYHNFSINDKLVKRAKYLNEQIHSLQDL